MTDKPDKPMQLQELIQALDTELYQGYSLKKYHEDKFKLDSVDKTLTSEEIIQRKKEYEADVNKWLSNTAQIILDNSEEKYNYFHFVNVEKTAMSISTPLGNLSYEFDKHLFALEEIILRLEEKKNLQVRKDIADKEYKADILYEIKFSWHTREIKLNDMILATPNSDSKNYNFFEYVFSRPNEVIKVKDIETKTQMDMADNIQDILRDLGFKGNRRKVFFPTVTKTKVHFINPITQSYAVKNDLPSIKLVK